MEFRIKSTHFRNVAVLASEFFRDSRGDFSETFRADKSQKSSLPHDFVQANPAGSKKNVNRGLHFQWEPPMGKLKRVVQGTAFPVPVNRRKGSPTPGKWFGTEASGENGRQDWAPASFARGFCAPSDFSIVEYQCTGIYQAQGEAAIRRNDPAIGVEWPVAGPLVSEKDRNTQSLANWLESPESEHFNF